jgi:hypothetical protein
MPAYTILHVVIIPTSSLAIAMPTTSYYIYTPYTTCKGLSYTVGSYLHQEGVGGAMVTKIDKGNF